MKFETNRPNHLNQRDGTPTQLVRGHWLWRGLISGRWHIPPATVRTGPRTSSSSSPLPRVAEAPLFAGVFSPVHPAPCTWAQAAGETLCLHTSEPRHTQGGEGLPQGTANDSNRCLHAENSCSNANERRISRSGAAAAPPGLVTHKESPGSTSAAVLVNYWWHVRLTWVKP